MANLKFELVCIDFNMELPKIQAKFDTIRVDVDTLIKIIHFISIITTRSAFGIDELFMRESFRYHGIPSKIISNRDCNLRSEFWTILFTL